MDDKPQQSQNFASIATIRAALADVIDGGRRLGAIPVNWAFGLSNESDAETKRRTDFMDAVIKRIAELQAPPHDGIKLENLCDFHKRRSLPAPTASSCVMCDAEGVKR